MKNLDPIYKPLLIGVVSFFGFILLFYMFIFSSLDEERDSLYFQVLELNNEIEEKNPWASNEFSISSVEEKVREVDGKSRISDKHFTKVDSLTRNRINKEKLRKEFSDLNNSSLNARFRSEFSDFLSFLESNNMKKPASTFFNIDEKILDRSQGALPAWQLILKLWCAEFAIGAMKEAGLQVRQVGGRASDIDSRKLPIYYYHETNKMEDPSMIAISVSFRVEGSSEAHYKLLTKVNSSDYFLPISYYESKLKVNNEAASNNWESVIEFSLLLRLETKNKKLSAVFP